MQHRIASACLLVILLAKADGLRCYSCNLIGDPLKCQTTEICGDHKICVVTETIDSAFNLTYRLGCENEQDCSDIARRSSDVRRSLTEQCCREDLCNRGYPRSLTARPTTPSPTTVTTRPTHVITTPSTDHTTRHQHHVPTSSLHLSSIAERCPHGHSLDGYCYVGSIQYGHQWSKVNRHTADTYCRNHNMTLTSIHSKDEEMFLTRLMQGNPFWLGIKDIHWDDGTNFNFNRWDSRNYHSSTNRNCVVVVVSGEDYLWRTESCDQHHYFVCKRKMQIASQK